MRWSVIGLIWRREVRDQLRDRRTVFMLVILPILLYPALGMSMVQFAVLFAEQPMKVGVAGREALERASTAQSSQERFRIQKLPPLIDGKYFAPELFQRKPSDRELIELVFDDENTLAEMMERDEIQAYIVFTEDFVRSIRDGRRVPLPLYMKGIETDTSLAAADAAAAPKDRDHTPINERGELAHTRLRSVFREWQNQIVHDRLQALAVPQGYDEPLVFPERKPTDRAERAFTRLFPFLLVMMALTGALYPAIDVCAGEKERGTMETLLISPVSRSEIVWGKFLTVWLFSAVTALMNLASMGLTALHFSSTAGSLLGGQEGALPTPGLAAFGWCVVLMIPLAAFLSAMCLALSVYARSTKEGQYYLMPLMMVVLPLTLLSTAPGIELSPVYSMLPITGASLLLQELMNARTADQLPWLYLAPVLIPLAAYCYLALRWAVVQFNREDVLFREAARLDLKLWMRHLLRDKEPLPSAAEAVTCVVLIMLVSWFAGGSLVRANFTTMMLVQQLVFIAMPALMMALFLTSNPKRTLRFNLPPFRYIAFGVALAITLHAPMVRLMTEIGKLFPNIEHHLRAMQQLLMPNQSLTVQILLLAALPAVCEEIAFRGFILSGLSRSLGTRRAIVASSLLFALAHMDAFRFLHLLVMGLVLGLITVRSSSLLPGIVLHFLHNGLGVTISYYGQFAKEQQLDLPRWLSSEYLYSWRAIGIFAVFGVLLLGSLIKSPRRLGPDSLHELGPLQA